MTSGWRNDQDWAPSTTVLVDVNDDLDIEGPETVDLTVVQVVSSGLMSDYLSNAIVSIADNDPSDDLSQTVWVARVDSTAQENYESYDQWNQGKVELRRAIADGMLNVNYAVTGTATLDSDYSLWGPVATGYYNYINTNAKLGATGKVTFADGQDRLWVRVAPIFNSDAALETAEFAIVGGSGYAVAAPDKGTVSIYDDRPPAYSMQPSPYGDYTHNPLMDVFIGTGPNAGDATAAEAGVDPGAFRVTYKHWSEDAGFVPPDPPDSMWILGGTAKESEDYTTTISRESVDVYTEYTNPDTGLVVYSVSSVYRIDITPIDDTEWEGVEDVDVAIPRTNLEGAVVGVAQITLADNDSVAVPEVWVEASDGVASELELSTASFRIARDEINRHVPLTVSYSFTGSAFYGEDYTLVGANGTVAQSGAATFQPGQRAVEIRLTPNYNTDAEGLENVVLNLSGGGVVYSESIRKADGVGSRLICYTCVHP